MTTLYKTGSYLDFVDFGKNFSLTTYIDNPIIFSINNLEVKILSRENIEQPYKETKEIVLLTDVIFHEFFKLRTINYESTNKSESFHFTIINPDSIKINNESLATASQKIKKILFDSLGYRVALIGN